MNDVILRKEICHKRSLLNPAEKNFVSKKMAALFMEQPFFLSSHTVAFYCAVNGEIDPSLIMERAWELGKTCYLPVLDAHPSRHLRFVRYAKGDSLVPNRFGIPEPVVEKNKLISPEVLDLVITPLVAFDLQGHRLGMGSGYYDTTFGFLLKPSQQMKPKLIGVAYEFQCVEHLTAKSWDVSLNGIITENTVYLL